jgi:DNA repair exonuclease SbcCD nuclease subunit
MSDMENKYRYHDETWCRNIANHIKTIKNKNLYFTNYPNEKTDPQFVIHGGDLSDTVYEWKMTADQLFSSTYQQFYDAGIPFISSLGNHDLLNYENTPHAEAAKFVERSFQKAAALSPEFTYQKNAKDNNAFNDYYVAKFRGRQIATVNNQLEANNNQWTSFKSKLNKSKPAIFSVTYHFEHRNGRN